MNYSDAPTMSREILARHSRASTSEGERVVVLGMAPATIQNRLREAREHGLLIWGMLSMLALYGVADLCYVVARRCAAKRHR
jgi:hypothetical protein